jgi:hypothetical protein
MKVTVGGTLAINTIATGTEFYQDAVINGLTLGKGHGSLSTNVAVGVNARDSVTSGVDNTAIGHSTMQNITQGIDNAAFGTGAMVSTTTGNNNTSIGSASLPVNTTGSSNTAVGLQAMQVNTTGGANTVVGMNALNDNTEGNRNTALGFGSGNGIITGSDNVHIGYNTTSGATDVSNEIVIGSSATGKGSDTALIAGDNVYLGDGALGGATIERDANPIIRLIDTTNSETFNITNNFSGGQINYNTTTLDHRFKIGGTDKLTIGSSTVSVSGNLAVDTNTLYVDAASNKTVFNNLIQIRDAGSYLHIGANTSDGSDNETLYITGGGDASGARGAVIGLAGNESGGNLSVIAGRETNAYINFLTGTASSERMRIDSSGNVQLAASEQAIQWASGNGIIQAPSNLYIRTSSAGGNLLFQVNNDEKMRIDSSGNVGIGESSARNARLLLNNAGSQGAPQLMFVDSGDSGKQSEIRFDSGDLIFDYWSGASRSERMRIDSSGNITQTASGNPQFTISGSAGAYTGILQINAAGGGGSKIQTSGGTNSLSIETGGSESMRIDSSGNVGIGTSNAGAKIEINASGGGLGGFTSFKTKYGTSSVQSLSIGQVTAGNGAWIGMAQYRAGGFWQTEGTAAGLINFEADGVISFSTNSGLTANTDYNKTERMRITSGGQLLINTQTLPNGTSAYGAGFAPNSEARTTFHSASNTTSSVKLAYFLNPNGEVGSIATSGSSTAFNTSSDYRLKENVVEMTGALDRVDALKPSRFNFIADPEKTVDGFIAHEVQAIVPEAVTGEKDAVDEEGNPIYQGIDQSKIVPLLVGAIKELSAKVAALESQLNA